jgi:hypothetical protein
MGIERKDWLLRETEKLSRMIALLLGFRRKGDAASALELIQEFYTEMLGLPSGSLPQMPEGDFLNILRAKNLKPVQLEALAEFLVQQAGLSEDSGDMDKAAPLYRKAASVLRYVAEVKKEYSIEREEKIRALMGKGEEMR